MQQSMRSQITPVQAGGAPAKSSHKEATAVAELLGRAPGCEYTIAARDIWGQPLVICNAPLTEAGSPMPTRWWLVGARAVKVVSRLESTGGIKRAESAIEPLAVARAHSLYAIERDRHIPIGHVGPRPTGGVGGTRVGIKCLHAHLAWYLVGGDDPVGRWVIDQIGDELEKAGAMAAGAKAL